MVEVRDLPRYSRNLKFYTVSNVKEFSHILKNVQVAHGFICLFSVLNSKSFIELGYLINAIFSTRKVQNMPIVIAGNKVDKAEQRVVFAIMK